MRGTRSALLAAASLCLVSNLALAADPYADYRIPAHGWFSWSASATGAGSHNRSQSPFSGLANQGGFSGLAGTSLAGGYDSDANQWAFGLNSALSGSRSYSSAMRAGLDDLRRDRTAHEVASGFGALTTYPWSAPVGLTINLSPSVSLDQSWTSADHVSRRDSLLSLASSATTSGRYSVNVLMSGSVGLGKVRDVTPVYQAQILESRLLASGTLTRELSPHAREQLAGLYTIESRVAFAHSRPTKFFWRELERVLREDGSLGPDGLDAYSVQRLLEPLSIVGSALRRAGFSVGPQVLVTTSRFHTSDAFASSSAFFINDSLAASTQSSQPRRRRNARQDRILTGFTAEVHRPLGMRWQADGLTRALLTESGEDLAVATSLAATWLVSDRWVATTTFAHSAQAAGHRAERRVNPWQTSFAASLNYFLEDDWSLGASWQMDQQHQGSFYNRREAFSLGVTYQLAGLLNAAGLIQPMRLSPSSD